jgi:hypothetical protein
MSVTIRWLPRPQDRLVAIDAAGSHSTRVAPASLLVVDAACGSCDGCRTMVRLFRKEPKALRAEELDGVRGEAVVLESVAGPVVFETTNGFAMNDGDHKRWARQVPMVVQVPDAANPCSSPCA